MYRLLRRKAILGCYKNCWRHKTTLRLCRTQACLEEDHDQALYRSVITSGNYQCKIVLLLFAYREMSCIYARLRTNREIVLQIESARTKSGLIRTNASRPIVATSHCIGRKSRDESGNLRPNSVTAGESMRTGIHSHLFAVEVILAPMQNTESHHHSTKCIAMKVICSYNSRYSMVAI